ncbi:DNA topoisomerase III [Bacillus sp. OAE603]|uniref:DNA topoisomerase III n=1 Tax=Gottfriedia sp. OAE603 TaxID=2663872 RepID=UPI00178BE0C8
MKLIIAEKPDQGLKLAAPFQFQKKKGYLIIQPNEFFPKGAYLTWAIGHLCELLSPEEYDEKWKKWSLTTLPIIPNRFQHKVTKGKYDQFSIIKNLVHTDEVSEIILAGDCEREGEHIVRLILNLAGNKKPMKRLWISSLTENAVRKGFSQLLDEGETKNLFFEAYSRACADWLVGMNASRVYSLHLQKKGIQDVFSLGRVQTPTLALIVKRELEIEKFQSEPFWEVFATFQFGKDKFFGKWHKDQDSKIKTKDLAEKIATFCVEKEAHITEIEQERKEFHPPFLYNLSSLQADANAKFKFSPQKTLEIAQKLYVKGIISYPRSDSSFITKEEALMLPDILKKIQNIEQFQGFFPLPNPSILNNSRYVNEKKVTDHYAIIPTEQVPSMNKLNDEEQKIYELIVNRLISAHYESAIFDYTTIHTLVDQRASFVSKGKTLIQEGWRKVIFEKSKEKNTDEQNLPIVLTGDQGIVKKVEVKEKKTQPPKRYTEGQLITLMKSAGKHIENPELTKILNKTEGLGTEATRAGIIGTLKNRKYIDVKKNQVYATDKGKLIIYALGENILTSPEMTAKWEQRLSEIGDGKASSIDFMDQAKKLTEKIIHDAFQNESQWNFSDYRIDEMKSAKFGSNKKSSSVGKCIKCDGKLVDKGTFYGCDNYKKTKCSVTISKKILGKNITKTIMKQLLSKEPTEVIQGFVKDGNQFDASLKFSEEGKIIFLHTSKNQS